MMLYQELKMRVISHIIFCFILFFSVSALLESTVALSDEKEIKELQAKRKQAIDGFIKDGVFIKVVQPAILPHVHVDKGFYLLTYDDKSAVMNVVYAYYITLSEYNSIIIIKDGYTGKEIGSYKETGSYDDERLILK